MTFDVTACTQAMQELMAETSVGDPTDELVAAANFVLQYGSLGSFLEEPGLTQAQFWTGPPGAAFSLIGHWSVERNDPADDPGRGFEVHTQNCQVCRFLEEICVTNMVFEEDEEICGACGGGVDAHGVGIHEAMGTPALYCVGQWDRVEPDVVDMGRVSHETQVSASAWATSWWAPLADGSFATVTRTYFVSNNAGRVVLVRTDDYVVCTDPAQPSATEIKSEWRLNELDSDDPHFEDLRQLAVDSFPPDPGEWDQHGPGSDRFVVPDPA